MSNTILAVDPGLSGALAFYDPDLELLEVLDMPTFSVKRNGAKRREIDLYGLANLIDCRARTVRRAVIEQVGARPGQGVTSMFSFGYATGIVTGAIVAHLIPLELISPAIWKRKMGVSADKDSSRRKASMMLPAYAKHWTRSQDDGRAEAALLALYVEKFL